MPTHIGPHARRGDLFLTYLIIALPCCCEVAE